MTLIDIIQTFQNYSFQNLTDTVVVNQLKVGVCKLEHSSEFMMMEESETRHNFMSEMKNQPILDGIHIGMITYDRQNIIKSRISLGRKYYSIVNP